MMPQIYDESAFREGTEKPIHAFKSNDAKSSYRLQTSDAPKVTIRDELKRIRAENPDLYRSLSLDRFD